MQGTLQLFGHLILKAAFLHNCVLALAQDRFVPAIQKKPTVSAQHRPQVNGQFVLTLYLVHQDLFFAKKEHDFVPRLGTENFVVTSLQSARSRRMSLLCKIKLSNTI